MRLLKYVVITTTLASAMIFAQADKPAQAQPSQTQPASAPQADRTSNTPGGVYSRTHTGTVVNADCSQASILTGSGSSSSATAPAKDGTASSAAPADKDNKSVYDKQKEVLKHCRANDKTTAFAVLTDDGRFYKLDEAGNSQVTSLAGADKEKNKILKNLRVTVTGTPQGDTFKVQSLAKTDKPFGVA
jgi:hypothetical protein